MNVCDMHVLLPHLPQSHETRILGVPQRIGAQVSFCGVLDHKIEQLWHIARDLEQASACRLDDVSCTGSRGVR